MEKAIHEQQTETYDLRYCAVALLKALTTYNLDSATELSKIIQIEMLRHLRTNALIIN